MKIIAKTLLLALAFAGLAYWAWGKIAGPGDASEPVASEEAAAPSSSPEAPVVVTYFNSDVRCSTCVEIESLTRRAVEERFSDSLSKGQIAFQVLNMDKKENAHFVDDYELAFKTVVIRGDTQVRGEGDAETIEPWVKMDEVWSLTAKPDEFIDYLAAEISRRLPEQR